MSTTLTIDAKVLGQKKPLFTDWVIALPPEPGAAGASLSPARADAHHDGALGAPALRENRMRLRDLITKVVQEEVSAFQLRQEERHLARLMTKGEIEQAIVQGKVDLGERDLKQKVDPNVAVETALEAFEDGLYYVFVEGEQILSLNHEISLRPNTRVSFVRLVALAGG